jgi:mannobiose 2-epimerase
MRCLFSILLLALSLSSALAKELDEYSAQFQQQLSQKIMPYWLKTGVDQEYGGYLLADPSDVNRARQKQIVTQARMLWGFSHAYIKKLGTNSSDYLLAARQGYEFIEKHFRDPEHGGYYWTTDRAGKPSNHRKIVYGESFVIYGLVEYHRASGERAPLDAALRLFQDLQHHAHDTKSGGWVEHFERDWTPVLKPDSNQQVEIAGYKSANTHLHLMEAFTELFLVSGDTTVRKALEESLKLNMTYFYPADPAQSAFHRQLDWKEVVDPASAGLSYGHNVEFAWLMIAAQKALGQTLSWDHFQAHLDHALAHGYDHKLGGLYNRGSGNEPATSTDKVWWVQAEMLAALSDAIRHKPKPEYLRALGSLAEFIQRYQASPADGIWLDTVSAAGVPKVSSKAHNWKANYHDVRGLVKFIETFPPAPPPKIVPAVK